MASARLTKALVGNATFKGPATGTHIIWDSKLSGFGLRIAPGGTKSYVIRYRINRRQRIKKICDASRVALPTARTHAQSALALAEFGDDPYPAPTPEDNPITVKALCEEWLEKYAKVHRKSTVTPERRLRQNVIAPFGSTPAKDLTLADVEGIHHKKGIDEGKKTEANRV